MEIVIDHCLFVDENHFSANFIDNSDVNCGLQDEIIDGTNVTMFTPLDGCGTTQTAGNGTVTFSQTIYYKTWSGLIYLGNPASLDFTCTFSTEASASTNKTVSSVTTTTGSAGTGDFSFELGLYTDDTFATPIEASDVIIVGERVNFAVSSPSLPSNVEFVIGTCTVGHGGLSYPILTDGCGDALVQTEYAIAGPFANVAQLSYDAFRFDTGADINEDQTETITCSIHVCDAEDDDSLCNTRSC